VEINKGFRLCSQRQKSFNKRRDSKSNTACHYVPSIGNGNSRNKPFHYDHRNDQELEKLVGLIGGDIPTLVGMQLFEDMQLLREIKPDIYFVDPHYAGIGARMGVPTVSNHFSNRGAYVGFKGAYNLAKSLFQALIRKDFFEFSGMGECKYREREFFPWKGPYYGMLKSGVYHNMHPKIKE
jgi:Nitrogenase molybdenum-iron protein, alpha and beta chains